MHLRSWVSGAPRYQIPDLRSQIRSKLTSVARAIRKPKPNLTTLHIVVTGRRLYGSTCGRSFPETGADPCREACAQLHDGHAVDQTGIDRVPSLKSQDMIRFDATDWPNRRYSYSYHINQKKKKQKTNIYHVHTMYIHIAF